MTIPPVLPDDVLATRLEALQGWEVVDGKLHRELRFADFVTAWGVMSSVDSFVRAFGFMTSVAITAEAMNHHPEWSNVYSRVSIDLVTHDAGGITEYDLELAAAVERLAAGRTS